MSGAVPVEFRKSRSSWWRSGIYVLDDVMISTSLDDDVNLFDAISAFRICNECFKIDVDKLDCLKLTGGRFATITDAFSSQSWFSSSDHLQQCVERVQLDMKKFVENVRFRDYKMPRFFWCYETIIADRQTLHSRKWRENICRASDIKTRHQYRYLWFARSSKQFSNIFCSSVYCGIYLAWND